MLFIQRFWVFDLPHLTLIYCFQRRNGLGRVVGAIAGVFALSVTTVTEASETNGFPLPFSGTYQSLASEARQLTSWDENSWVTIPQNVYLSLVKDKEIVEVRLRIEVLNDIGRVLYPIENRMWLRSVAGNQLQIYKLNKTMGNFEQVGDGACTAASCSYQYVTLAQNNGNPYKQRYMSTISWAPGDIGRSFSQSGSLSVEVTEEPSGQKSWLVFKTWTNQFEAMPES